MSDKSLHSLSIEVEKRIDQQCLRFEEAWKNGGNPRIEDFVREVGGKERRQLLRELLRIELEYLRAEGETPVADDYQKRFADDAEMVAVEFDSTTHDFRQTNHSPRPTQNVKPTFPNYEILEEISPGVGGMGMVFKVRDVNLDKVRAVKTPKTHMHSAEGREFFRREAKNAARLDHPNIVKIFNLDPNHEPPYYVMDFVAGRPLDKACEGATPKQVAELVEQIARALAYAHGQGVIHRDIKPNNVLVNPETQQVSITDFGLAEHWEEVAAAGNDGSSEVALAGTAQFIAPEVYSGTGPMGPTVDIYALGVTLFRLLCGRYPVSGSTLDEVKQKVLFEEPPLPKDINPDVPEPLQRICLKAIERNPAHRYQSAELMADALRRFLDGRKVLDRPTRYDLELLGKLKNHETDIQAWHEQNLITAEEMDSLLRPYYWFTVRSKSSLSQRFPWETMSIRLGGWLVLLSSLLWLIFYWPEVDEYPHGHLLSVGFPTLAINGLGWFFYRWKSKWNTRIFLGTGALLLPLTIVVVLDEYAWLQYHQGESYELFTSDLDKNYITPTNLQLTLAATGFLAYCLLLVRNSRIWLFLIWSNVGVYLVFTGVLSLFGLKEWLTHDSIAFACCCYLCLSLMFPLVAGRWQQRAAREEAAGIYGFFPVPFVALATLLAYYGSVEWLNVDEFQPFWQPEAVNLWWMTNGVIFCLLGGISIRAKSGYIRFWSGFFLLLVPVSLLLPSNFLFRTRQLFDWAIGGEIVTLYELSCGAFAIFFVVLGTVLRRWTLALPGLIGLAVFVFRVTHLHFSEYLAWPFAVATGGGMAMLAGVISALVRERLQRRASPRLTKQEIWQGDSSL